MSTLLSIILLVAGLLVLWKSADFLVAGAVALAKRLGVSPLVIGLTIVAMGTSAPEVAASIAAVFTESGGGTLALGNVYGSNIANLALVGGLVALIQPMRIRKQTLKREIPVMIGVGLLLWPLLRNLAVSRFEGALLLTVFTVLILLTIYAARKERVEEPAVVSELAEGIEKIEKPGSMWANIVFIIIGLVGLAAGAKMSLIGAVDIGKKIGLSEAVIGLTIVALGTSLPELVTCVVAAAKGQHDISVGNLVGSNIFNTLLVTGPAGVVKPFDIVRRLSTADFWIMIAVTAGFAVLAIIGRRKIGRLGGTALLGGYIAYVLYLLWPIIFQNPGETIAL
jgi:cation:H+ antiporter